MKTKTKCCQPMVEVSHYNQSAKRSLSDNLENVYVYYFLQIQNIGHKLVSHDGEQPMLRIY